MSNERGSILSEIENGVARVTLNQPPLNILDIAMMGELHQAIAQINSSGSAKVLVLDHRGKAFSAGVSIQDHTPDKVGQMIETFHGVLRLLNSLALPTVALVDGMALGGGCELAVFCDIVLASERATFGQPEIKVGVFPPVAAVLFPRLIGRNRTLELLLSGDTIDANEARSIGLINKVFLTESFRAKAGEFIAKLTAMSGPVLRWTKRAVDAGLQANFNAGLAAIEQIYLRDLMATEDAREGLNAFLEKRQPAWKEK